MIKMNKEYLKAGRHIFKHNAHNWGEPKLKVIQSVDKRFVQRAVNTFASDVIVVGFKYSVKKIRSPRVFGFSEKTKLKRYVACIQYYDFPF